MYLCTLNSSTNGRVVKEFDSNVVDVSCDQMGQARVGSNPAVIVVFVDAIRHVLVSS